MPLSVFVYSMVLSISFTICGVAIAARSGKRKQLKLEDFLKIFFSANAIILVIRLIYTVVTSQNLMNLLGDNITTLFVGAFVVIWVSIKESFTPFI